MKVNKTQLYIILKMYNLLCKKKKIIVMYFIRLYYISNSILWGCILPLISYTNIYIYKYISVYTNNL